MIEFGSVEYFRAREQEELARAATALNPKVAAVHRDMARRYSILAGASVPSPAPLMSA
ncbi:hypothetical protein ACFOMD_03765 [Sphingoaurantiacus capsulatus]|uniref:Uncharacterized protein n=1 Tax=Sphingoaurantiacus capsulatus TaxID=1771310 RepID=A0ABV7X6N7_9SPHN